MQRHHDTATLIQENIELGLATVSSWQEAWRHAGSHGAVEVAERSTSG